MNHVIEDRRVRKTKQLLKQSLCQLLEQKKIEEITIQEITNSADLNRRTFYLHYKDIYDLFEHIKADTISDFVTLLQQSLPIYDEQSLYNYLQKLLEYIQDNLIVCKIIFRQAQFVDCITKTLINYFITHQSYLAKDYYAQYGTYIFTFFIHGMTSTFNLWLNSDNLLSIAELSSLLCNFIFSGCRIPLPQPTTIKD